MDNLNPMDRVAIRKANGGPTWRPYLYESIHGAILITGCATTTKTRGPNKGDPKYLVKENRRTVAVTRDEIDAEERANG